MKLNQTDFKNTWTMKNRLQYTGYIYSKTLIDPSAKGTEDEGKMYIGKTTNLERRFQKWNNAKSPYGGRKINEARSKYGVSDASWKTDTLETITARSEEELKSRMKKAEEKYILQYNSVEKGFNSSYGDGNMGITFTEKHKEKISKAMKGRKLSDETKRKIGNSNKGKVRTAEMKKAQSERMKGKAPLAAIEAAKKWRKENGGYWKGKKRTEETIEKMRNAQQEKAIKIVAHYPDGKEKEFDSMASVQRELKIGTGSIHNNLRHSSPRYRTKGGYWFNKLK